MKHLRSALLRLQDNGRLVAIVPHWLSPEKQPKYFASLPSQLQLSLFVDGSHYRHHGTTMDTRILVFDKISQTEIPKSIDLKFATTARELSNLAAQCPERKIYNPHQGVKIAGTVDFQPQIQPPIQLLFAGLPLFQIQPAAQLEIIFEPVVTVPNLAPPIVAIEPRKQFEDLVQLDYQPATKDESPMTDGVYAVYRGAIEIAGATQQIPIYEISQFIQSELFPVQKFVL